MNSLCLEEDTQAPVISVKTSPVAAYLVTLVADIMQVIQDVLSLGATTSSRTFTSAGVLPSSNWSQSVIQ